MKILFISRAHPPVIGGIENQNEAVGRWLSKVADCKLIVNRLGKRFLPFFIPYAITKSLFVGKKADVILLGDGVLTIVGWVLKLVYRQKPVVCIVHGLDVTYSNVIYQSLWVSFFYSAIDRFIAVSKSTRDIAVEKGVDENNIAIIPNGIDIPDLDNSDSRKALSEYMNVDLDEKKILLTLGRLVERKGVHWFLLNVMPSLPNNVIYIVAGDGPERDKIQSILQRSEYSERVFLMGGIDSQLKRLLFQACDLFIQPNVPVTNDIEGFGVAVIESGSYGLPVLASDLEGLKDSVNEGVNGWRVQPLDATGFINKISSIMKDMSALKEFGKQSRQYTKNNYDWSVNIDKYMSELETA